uniref:Uncharacterized protein n=1 Tax=Rhizophora mucronata TaxID=61149 RepID=A0A2P2N9J6_RHIMU
MQQVAVQTSARTYQLSLSPGYFSSLHEYQIQIHPTTQGKKKQKFPNPKFKPHHCISVSSKLNQTLQNPNSISPSS